MAPPKFAGVSQDKRGRDALVATSDDVDGGQDENSDANTSVTSPPPKKQQLSKAQLRKRNVQLSKLTVELTEKRMELEGHIEAENFFEAEKVKAEIEALTTQRAGLTV